MKQLPIRYKAEVGSSFYPYKKGTPARTKSGDFIGDIWVEMEPSHWNSGSYVMFEIIREVYKLGELPRKERLCHTVFYDRDNPQHLDRISALASQDIRGHSAELMTSTLFWDLFSTSPEMKMYLPEVHKFYKGEKAKQAKKSK